MAILHLPPPSSVDVRERPPEVFGEVGELLYREMVDVWWHWSKHDEPTNGDHIAELGSDDDEDFTYRPVKLPIVGTIRVRYRIGEPLKPRPFEFDDEDEE